MVKKSYFLILLGVILLLGSAGLVGLYKQVTFLVDGQPQPMNVLALTVGDALRAAGIPVRAEDRLDPSASSWLATGSTIRLDRARPVSIYFKGIPITILSSERLPEKLLAQAGIPFHPSDQLFLDGQRVLAGQRLPPAVQYTLQVRPAVEITLQENGKVRKIQSARSTLIQALWDTGIQIHAGDRLSLPPETRLDQPLQVELQRAVPVMIQVGQRQISAHIAADTVGQALAIAGVPLQGLDYSRPAEDQPLPADGKIQVVRVHEDIVLAQSVIPFKNEFQPDPETDLDQRRIIQPGQYGVEVTRERVRYEDGKEVSRSGKETWVASQAKPQRIGLGTRASVLKVDTPDGPMEYYRSVTVYATSYSPCRQGTGKCSKSTASGTPLKKGVIAVTQSWYSQFAGQRIYVPGYGVGVVGDTGGGIAGTYWIDLGYGEDDFTNWHQNVTIYFLAPAPANVPWRLP